MSWFLYERDLRHKKVELILTKSDDLVYRAADSKQLLEGVAFLAS